jgi:tRNA(Ile)-lysidine synthase
MLLSKVRKSMARYGLLEVGDKVLVACSGGADSTALLAALMGLSGEYELKIAVAHFNHRLRRAADQDERFVIRLAGKLGLPVYVRREDVRTLAAKRGQNIEEAGRERRYRFLRDTARRIDARRIATGHTLTDQAETVLLRILRGTGPRGLGGIAPSVDGLIIRPLIDVERREVEAFLRSRKIPHREDESNQDLGYLRNRVRRRLLPYLEKSFEPRIVRHLGKLAEISREEEKVWAELFRTEEERSIIRKEGTAFLDARRLSTLPPGSGRRLVRAFLVAVRGDLRRFSFRDVEAVRCLAEQKEAALPGNLLLRREKGLISVPEKRLAGRNYELQWDGEKRLAIPELRLAFVGRRTKKGRSKLPSYDDSRRALVDAAKIKLPLSVRNLRKGDRYRPLGSPGRKKLTEVMRSKGIPPHHRNRLPVFLSGGKIIWAPGLPASEDFKITPATRWTFVIDKRISRFRKRAAPRAGG